VEALEVLEADSRCRVVVDREAFAVGHDALGSGVAEEVVPQRLLGVDAVVSVERVCRFQSPPCISMISFTRR
jgi:hypothetical protein